MNCIMGFYRRFMFKVRRFFRKQADISKLKAAQKMYQFKIENLSDEQIEDLKEAFVLFDHDEDGTIDSKELGTLMKCLGENPTENELEQMINKTDLDESGAIEFPEFIILMEQRLRESYEEDLQYAFTAFDPTGKGNISIREIKAIMMSITESVSSYEMFEVMKKVTKERDNNQLNFQDFSKIMCPFPLEKDFGTTTMLSTVSKESVL